MGIVTWERTFSTRLPPLLPLLMLSHLRPHHGGIVIKPRLVCRSPPAPHPPAWLEHLEPNSRLFRHVPLDSRVIPRQALTTGEMVPQKPWAVNGPCGRSLAGPLPIIVRP